MAKIKRKVEMILPELIEWGFKQKELLPFFYGSREGSFVQFTPDGWVNITGIESTDTFTVEVEEEITEDTKLDTVLEIYKDLHSPGSISSVIQKNTSINNIMEYNPSYFKTECLYLINEDMTLTLIWKDGELVGDE